VGCHGPLHFWKIVRKVSDSREYYVGIVSGRRPSPNRLVTCRHAWLILLRSGQNDSWMSVNRPETPGTSQTLWSGMSRSSAHLKIARKVSDSREYYFGIVSGRHPSPNSPVTCRRAWMTLLKSGRNDFRMSGNHQDTVLDYSKMSLLTYLLNTLVINTNECINVLMFVGKCTNCGITSSEELCGLCAHNRQCRRCHRHLPYHLFQVGDNLCRACRNIDPNHIGRYALGRLVEEHAFTGDENDVAIDDFVRRHSDAINSTLNTAIAKHMYDQSSSIFMCIRLTYFI